MNTEKQISKNKPANNITPDDSVQSVNTIHYRGKSYIETPIEKLDDFKYLSKPKNHIEYREFYY